MTASRFSNAKCQISAELPAEVEAWLAEMSEQRRQSPLTIGAYRRDMQKLLVLVAQMPGTPALAALNSGHVRRALLQLHSQGLDGRSLARTLSAWRGFYRWLYGRGQVSVNPAQSLRPPKSGRNLPRALHVDEMNQLLDKEANSSDIGQETSNRSNKDKQRHNGQNSTANAALAVRDQAMFELLYSSGLRLSELVGLDQESVDSIRAESEVRVLGKRGKTRLVPVGRYALAALENWLTARVNLARADETALFVSQHGRRITPRAVQMRLASYARDKAMSQHVHPHMLRHSFASHVLQSSGDLRAVQEMLGHASIASTQVYTHLDFQHLAKAYDLAHPRARR